MYSTMPSTHLIPVFALTCIILSGPSTNAALKLDTGNSSLLGGDLTDPINAIVEKEGVNYGQALSEDEMRPLHFGWIDMKMSPVSPPAAHRTKPIRSKAGRVPRHAAYFSTSLRLASGTSGSRTAAKEDQLSRHPTIWLFNSKILRA